MMRFPFTITLVILIAGRIAIEVASQSIWPPEPMPSCTAPIDNLPNPCRWNDPEWAATLPHHDSRGAGLVLAAIILLPGAFVWDIIAWRRSRRQGP